MSEARAATPHVQPLELYTGADFLRQLPSKIAATGPGDRVSLMTMCLNPHETLVAPVLEEFGRAAQRGVNVSLGVDACTFFSDTATRSLGPAFAPIPFRQQVYRQRQAALDQLREQGVNCTVTNWPDRNFSNPYAGRSHIKATIINDEWYIQGFNLHSGERFDVVSGGHDATTADWLDGVMQTIIDEGSTKALGDTDLQRTIDSLSDIVVDVGKPGESAIQEAAYDVIRAANEWLVVSTQYFPRKHLTELIGKAIRRDVEVQLLTNVPMVYGRYVQVGERLAARRYGKLLPPTCIAYPTGNVMHAKAIANESMALVGTHNFDPRGVQFGTAEIALLRRDDPIFSRAVGQLLLSCQRPTLSLV